MPGWDHYPIRDHLRDLWGVPVSLGNDAEYGALGEWAYGAGRDETNLVYVKVGSGIGVGLMIGGAIYRGSSGAAGEIGHITIDERGPRCSCGNRGCLDAVAGGRAIAMNAIRAVRLGEQTRLTNIQPIESLTAWDVGEAARLGDLVAQRIVSDAGANLGIAIANTVNLINPGMVIVGGGVAQMGDLLLEPIRRAVTERCLTASANSVRITTATLGRRATSVGAVVQALTVALHTMTEKESV
jgi:predicted NBD/HSP70 family sugar kinase